MLVYAFVLTKMPIKTLFICSVFVHFYCIKLPYNHFFKKKSTFEVLLYTKAVSVNQMTVSHNSFNGNTQTFPYSSFSTRKKDT